MSDIAAFYQLDMQHGWTLLDAYLVGMLMGMVLTLVWRSVFVSLERNRQRAE